MRLIRIGLAAIDSTVGATRTNTDKGIDAAFELNRQGCTFGVMNEQLIGGYPAEDLLLSPDFVAEQGRQLARFALETRDLDTLFTLGVAVPSDNSRPYNAAAVIHRGRVLGIVPKERLPSYGVFDERRVFTAGVPGLYRQLIIRAHDKESQHVVPLGDLIFDLPFAPFGVATCEDTWTADGPLWRRGRALVHGVINGSPARLGVVSIREQMLATRSADHECIVAAAYQVGGNDALAFDGGGYIFQNGQMILDAPRFKEGVFSYEVDLSRTERMRAQNTTWVARQEALQLQGETCRTIRVENGPDCLRDGPTKRFARGFRFLPERAKERAAALDYLLSSASMATGAYFEKSKAFKKFLIALSGGKDSALVLLLVVKYLRNKFRHLPPEELKKKIKEMVLCVSMPTRFNSKKTKTIARELAQEVGADFIEQSIQEEVDLEIAKLRRLTGKAPTALTIGNIQARIRGERMWNLSNETGGMWLQTSNMSEVAVGYSTIGGDHMGAYSPIKNFPKTVVVLALKRQGQLWRLKSIAKLLKTRASAELAENQFDEDDLMPFDVLDLCFLLFAGEWYSPADIYRVARVRWTDKEFAAMRPGFQPPMLKAWVEKFMRLFRQSIFKWVVSPLGAHVGSLDLDRERALQIPVINSAEWFERSLQEMRDLP